MFPLECASQKGATAKANKQTVTKVASLTGEATLSFLSLCPPQPRANSQLKGLLQQEDGAKGTPQSLNIFKDRKECVRLKAEP